ncbi:MAG: Flp pilus assembly complex ATPase component TadA [Deltaproteobacteria bacterium]|nr:Flp pilus assembly complex ATPase component TadA [Deltaproteobacteria bacterium]
MLHISDKEILDILSAEGFLSPRDHKTVLAKASRQRERLKQRQSLRGVGALGQVQIEHPVTIVDVLASLQLPLPGSNAGVLDEERIMSTLARHLNIAFRKIDPLKLDLDVVTKTIPRLFALKHLVVPVDITDGRLEVVMYDPTDASVLEDIRRVTTLEVTAAMGTKADILKIIGEFFGFKSSIMAAQTQLTQPSVDLGNLEQYTRLKPISEIQSTDTHIKNAVDYLFHYALGQRASDIHVEPKRDNLLIRFRIDGVLHTIYKLPKAVYPAMISRIKALARLDIAEKRRPQDGRIKLSHQDQDAEIRVSTVPVAFGEKAVLRILDPTILFQDLEDLGFSSKDLILYRQFLKQPHGIILITGPTGSGKSTTLYSSLAHLASSEKNITTVEDPIEMIREDFNQIAVQPVVGITFASILRNILRQDPDIIMIGEIRDHETAQNAIQAALTGHLVFSTLHTNDAPSTITRLMDLGIKPFLISDSVIGVVAQRLLRKICPYCTTTLKVDAGVLKSLGPEAAIEGKEWIELRQGEGCVKCRGTGFLGRTGVFEVMAIDEDMQEAILEAEKLDIAIIRKRALASGMVPLRKNAIDKMRKGITTLQEVSRVTEKV